jgi:hypothetical protein
MKRIFLSFVILLVDALQLPIKIRAQKTLLNHFINPIFRIRQR